MKKAGALTFVIVLAIFATVSANTANVQIWLPIVYGPPAGGTIPTPTPTPEIEWDSRLTERGAYLIPAEVPDGNGYWKIVKARWYDAVESQGRHHIYMDVVRDGRRAVGVPLEVGWPNGVAMIVSEAKPKEEWAANFAMYALAPSYYAQPKDNNPADRIAGMGLGSIEEPDLGIHTSYSVRWVWVEK